MSTVLTDGAIKNIAKALLVSNGDDSMIHIPKPSGGQLDTGVNISEKSEVNCRGEQVRAVTFTGEEKGKLQLDFGVVTPLLTFLRQDKKPVMVTGGTAQYFQQKIRLPLTGNTLAGSQTGEFGFGITSGALSTDAGTDATVSNAFGLGDPVTIAAAAAPTDVQTIAIGVNGDLTFSDDLRGADIHFRVPYTNVDYAESGNESFGELSLTVQQVTIDLRIAEWTFPQVTLDPSGSIPFASDNMPLNFFINGCYYYRSYALKNTCPAC